MTWCFGSAGGGFGVLSGYLGVVFVRKVRTVSGAVAVQVVAKDGRREVVVEHVGSAHDDAHLGILLERANAVVHAGQEMLDFDVPARVARVGDVADWTALKPEGQLEFPDTGPDGAGGAAGSVAARDVRPVAGAGRTVGTSSRLLYDVLGDVYDWLGFGVVGDLVFRDLVIGRIVEPTSKLDSLRVLEDLGADPVSYPTVMRHLRGRDAPIGCQAAARRSR